MDDDLTEYPAQRMRLQPCQICGRQFNAETLKKHQTICWKVSNKKRKLFDAGKQRATDSDVPYKATKRTAQIYTGEIRTEDDRSISKSKPNWREKHNRLIQSIRQARSVTEAIKQGGPLPKFQASDVPSDYVSCPYCHRNFNEHVAKRHIPFCQVQRERKQMQTSSKPHQQVDRGRTVPPQHSSSHKQQPSNATMYSNPHDVHSNGYKQIKSAPMRAPQHPPELQLPPAPPQTTGGGWGGFRKLLGLSSKDVPRPPLNYNPPDDEDDYELSVHRPVQQPVLMRTGRTQEHTSLNVRARHKNDDPSSYMRRIPPMQAAPSSYSQTRYHYGNAQTNSTRPTAVRRPLPASSGNQCIECGSSFNIATARFCVDCGSRR